MIDATSVSTPLVPSRAEEDEASARGGPIGLQRMCLAVLRAEWSTLAVIATDPRTGALDVSNALVDAAVAYRLRPVRALNGTGVEGAQVPRLLEALAAPQGPDGRTVVALDDPLRNAGSMPLMLAADAVLLLVRLGTSKTSAVEAIADMVGRERIVGCVVIPG